LQNFVISTGLHVAFLSEDLNARRTQGASGELTSDEALTRILDGTGLTYFYLDEHTVSIIPASVAKPPRAVGSATGKEEEPRAKSSSPPHDIRLTQAGSGQALPVAAPNPTESNAAPRAITRTGRIYNRRSSCPRAVLPTPATSGRRR
jgi:iron complex outermembrane recepter protein